MRIRARGPGQAVAQKSHHQHRKQAPPIQPPRHANSIFCSHLIAPGNCLSRNPCAFVGKIAPTESCALKLGYWRVLTGRYWSHGRGRAKVRYWYEPAPMAINSAAKGAMAM